MRSADGQIERLFRAARSAEAEPEMPFGFDTRVLALARGESPRNGSGRVLRRIATIATIVTVAAAAGAWWQISAGDSESLNAYTIADTAINGVLE
jgi:hypothetical protein